MRFILILGVLVPAFFIVTACIPAYERSSEYELKTGAIRTTIYRYGIPTETTTTEVAGWPLNSVPIEEHVWKRGGCRRSSSFFSTDVTRVGCGPNWGAKNGHSQLVWLLEEAGVPRSERRSIHAALGKLLEDPKGWWVSCRPQDAYSDAPPASIDAIYAEDYEGKRTYLWRRELLTAPPPVSSPE